ncbi:Lrp/AsnC family transcriptional regulator [Aliiruegeria sabulilitoris]|uniref:Lrp/AsnC family transcriptional regulator n=1 Tax=Aliiruegeria sabulilitoris TaxID=1510458 RepID=UPI0012E3962F|nr:Lrp/AsnC family transcriptional regulator [Aliiruegeria sabulilitoris]NDR56543.1 Lrp/AsnC family transcriptional regulator [Pseudoruegeria sp. M32A2M]
MDDIDRKICGLLQGNARASSAELAEAVGLSVSSAHERVRRLVSQGVVIGWQARLEPDAVGAGLCALVFIDMDYEGEPEACAALVARPEVMELHHVSGAHSYLMKIRVRDSRSLQAFLQEVLKPLPAVRRTETLLSLEALKETTAMPIAGLDIGGDDA